VLAALRGTDRAKLRDALVALEAGEAAVDADVCAALIDLLDDDSKEVRRRAAGALGRAAVQPGHHALLERALADEQPLRRWCAAFALSRAGTFSDAVARCAVEALASGDGDVRWAAAEIACEAARRRPESLGLLRDSLRSGSPEQRKMAIYCLRDLAAGDAPTFLAGLADADRGVRLAALSALMRLERLDHATIDRVIACMQTDDDDGVRRAAAATLKRLAAREPYAAEALARIASEEEKS
jgi:HEAT repeat protein